tara:strand:- start:233 stop:688 length:456 start_codon:yes stop_codon:yes gene_type:complete
LRLATKTFRNISLAVGLSLLFLDCGKESIQRNPYFVDIRFQRDLNLSLPLFNSLNFVGGSVLIPDLGISGVIVFNLNGNTFLAWEATCPNHNVKSCSALSVNGVLAECNCEAYSYSLATGQLLNPAENLKPPQGLLYYQVQNLNGILRVLN